MLATTHPNATRPQISPGTMSDEGEYVFRTSIQSQLAQPGGDNQVFPEIDAAVSKIPSR